MIQRKARKSIVSLLVVASILGLAGFVVWPKDRNLNRIGRPVMTLYPANSKVVTNITGWLPDGKLLACDIKKGRWRPYYILDDRTGAKTDLPKLNNAIAGIQSPLFSDLSPDRKSLLLCSYKQDAATRLEYFVVRLDDARIVKLKPIKNSEEYLWSFDSRGGYVWNSETGSLETWSLPGESHPHQPPSGGPSSKANPEWETIGPVPEGLLVYNEHRDPGGLMEFGRVGEDSRLQVLGSLKLPDNGSCHQVNLSPSGRKLAWAMDYTVESPKSPMISKFYSWLHLKSGKFTGLWVCDLDGSHLREVGWLTYSDDTGPMPMGWLSDDEHLWYRFGRKLWTVPVNP